MPKAKKLQTDELGRVYMSEVGMDEDAVAVADSADKAQKALATKAAGGVDVEEFDEPEPVMKGEGLSAAAAYAKAKREWDKRKSAWIAARVAAKGVAAKSDSKGGKGDNSGKSY